MRKRYIIFVVILVLLVNAFGQDGFKLPEYEKFKLKNGLTVYLMEHHEVPLIYINMMFPAGSVKDGELWGLADLTADGLLFGTKNYTKKQIEETLDFLGASYGTGTGSELAGLTMSFIKTDLEKVFPVLKDIVYNPTFDEEEFEKVKKRRLMELDRAKERPAGVISSYFDRFLFGDHVYGNPTGGTKGTVENITTDNLKKFYENNYIPGGSVISVVGDFSTAEMKKKITGLFSDWKAKGKPAEVKSGKIPKLSKNRVLLVNKDDATETRFLIGGFGVKRSNPDYVAIQVINTILGGRFTSWLNDELRVNAGLTYGAGSRFSMYKESGTFTISSYTRTAKTVEALDLALETYNRLFEKGVDEETLTSAKNYVNGQYPPRYETAGSLANLLSMMFVYDFDESFINDFQKNVDKLTVKKAKEIIKKYFPKDNLQFVLIGKASEIRDKAAKYGEITEKEIKAEGF